MTHRLRIFFCLGVFLAGTPAMGGGARKWFRCSMSTYGNAQMPLPCGQPTGFAPFVRCYKLTEEEGRRRSGGRRLIRKECGDVCENSLRLWKNECKTAGTSCRRFPGFTTVPVESYREDPSKLSYVCSHENCHPKPFADEAACLNYGSAEVSSDDDLVSHRMPASDGPVH